jgi:hypothetical protein
MKRKVGDIVKKKAGAGFVGEELIIKLADVDPGWPPFENGCFVCNKRGCGEWVNCELISDGKPTGTYVFHVSECEMEDC